MSSDMGITTGRLTLGGVKSIERSSSVSKAETKSAPVAPVPASDTVSLSSPEFLEKITQVQGFLEQISYGETIVDTALSNVDTIAAKLEEIGGVALRFEELLNSSISQDLIQPQAEKFSERLVSLYQDIDNISQNSGFEGENILQGDVVSFVVDQKDRNHLSVEGDALDSQTFGFRGLDIQTADDAQYLKNLVLQSLDQTSLLRAQLRSSSFEMQTRKEFSQSTIDVLVAQAQGGAQESIAQEAEALRSLSSKIADKAAGDGEFLAFDAQYTLLGHFK